ncbi:MAG: allophanate hydrolase subunit 1 [Rhodobacteraceae bacterium]|nr:allophanate hydrolase subunit 1 [Paracoccaceae bacterium]
MPPKATLTAPAPQLLAFGPDAVIVRFSLTPDPGANAAAQVFSQLVEQSRHQGLIEVVPSLASVMVRFDLAQVKRGQVINELSQLLQGTDWTQVDAPPPTRRWTIPAVFGGETGPQIDEAAACAGLSREQALTTLTQTPLQVLAIGFAPGQPFLGLLPDVWNFPRQSTLTPQVPAGALVVAVRQVVLFANPSATGWRWVGQTAFRPFQPEKVDPFPLRNGDEVRFEQISDTEYRALLAGENAGADVAHCEVLS